jgi:hypothetical protein
MISTPYAFRIMGGTVNTRRLVDYAKAFRAYCNADPAARLEVPAYLSAFVYPVEFRRHLELTGSTRDYRGSVGVSSIKFDVDRDGNLDAALHDTRRLAAFLVDRYRLDADDLMIGFSGSKGFHVELPVGWTIEPSTDANMTCRRFAEHVARERGVTIDSGVYDKVRPFRAWNSKHLKTGLYKVRISLDELLYLRVDAIACRAVEPIPFNPPPGASSPSLVADWEQATRDVCRQVEERQARRTGLTDTGLTDTGINALTRQLIVDPIAVEVGERHRRIFSAAANLAEFVTMDDLIRAILTEPGLNTGLSPREVERQIRTGIEHARRQRGEGGASV